MSDEWSPYFARKKNSNDLSGQDGAATEILIVRTTPETVCDAQRALTRWDQKHPGEDVTELFAALGLDLRMKCGHEH